jgi:hypothetical protein
MSGSQHDPAGRRQAGAAKLGTGQLAAGVFRQQSIPEAGAAGRALERHVIEVDGPAGPDVAAKVAEPGGEIVARDCHRMKLLASATIIRAVNLNFEVRFHDDA